MKHTLPTKQIDFGRISPPYDLTSPDVQNCFSFWELAWLESVELKRLLEKVRCEQAAFDKLNTMLH